MYPYITFSSPIGPLTLSASDTALKELLFCSMEQPTDSPSPLLISGKEELEAYFAGNLTEFSLPLDPDGTAFQKRVWQALLDVPYGETRSYGEIATAIGNPKSSRAVGGACHNNPLPIFIPCHRIVGSTGKLVGFSEGVDKKESLLTIEKARL